MNIATALRDQLARRRSGLTWRLRRALRRIHHRPRHFLGIFAIMQNEAHVIREWMDIHLREGVQHFFLLDHGSTDDWRGQVADHIRAGRVTARTLPAEGSLDRLRVLHADFALDGAEWLILQDLDEFTHATGRLAMPDFLRRLPPDVSQVVVPWVVFGTAGNLRQPPGVVAGCTRAEDMALRAATRDADLPWHVKSIVRARDLRRMHAHIHEVAGRTVLPLDDLPEVGGRFYIENRHAQRIADFRILQNHYVHQSLDFYRRKMQRRGYWLETNRGVRSYTMERFEREEARLNAVRNTLLLDRHPDADAAAPAEKLVAS
ncbi:glycosyltransferase family 2 protein [Roseomonas sp. AR75]|uniref:glycosyltransferase family 2 protein n=1 Tax=Roseomonas sp. AR75 TaxID=2562311 RepID=UPI0010C028A0|nr:glycosyltransferase family 2 protein [Roseomonas sp. AR75]